MFKRPRKFIGASKESQNKWCVAIVGMNAVGKTSLGKRLASKIGLKRIDSDALFTREHGNPQEYIQKHGVEDFRKLEEEIIIDALNPGNLVVLGGGAIGSEAVRDELKKKAAVIWISAHPKRVARQIEQAKKERPEFSDGSLEEIAKKLTKERQDLYKDVATITINENIPFQQFVPIAVAELRKYYDE